MSEIETLKADLQLAQATLVKAQAWIEEAKPLLYKGGYANGRLAIIEGIYSELLELISYLDAADLEAALAPVECVNYRAKLKRVLAKSKQIKEENQEVKNETRN